MKNDRTDKGRRLEFLSSIRTRIFLVSLVIGLAPCLFLQRGILENYERRAVDVQTGQAQTQLRAIANHLILSDYMNDSQSDLIDAELAEFSSIYDGRLLVIDSSLNIIKDTYSVSDGRVIISELVTDCLRTSTTKVSNYQSGDSYILIAMPITETLSLESGDHSGEPQPTESGASQGVLLASVSTENILTTLALLTRSALLMELIIVVIIIVLSFVFSILLVTPFEKLSQSIAKVRAGFSSRPVSAPEYLETRHIAEAFNVVLGRMNALDASRQEFVSNVSHELKTPMASMKVLADVLMSQEHAPEEMYREFLQDICHEID
jgi:signal transduction histidine kinase